MQFLTEPEPPRRDAVTVAPGVRRIVASNPGAMTYHGTNTYLIENGDAFSVLDPGPDDGDHLGDVVLATEGRISHILLTHTHPDHRGGARALHLVTNAPIIAWHHSAAPGFTPDLGLQDGDTAAGLVALHTPGHACDHVCFAQPGGVLFSGDHVMPWSTSVVSDMAAYVRSLERLLRRDDALYLPGHGTSLPHPRPFVHELLDHRRAREAAVAAALRDTPQTVSDLTDALYPQVPPPLRRAAERTLTAHLIKLETEGRAAQDPAGWHSVSGWHSV